jgi:6-phosphogluconate dehydrogenase
MEAKKELAIVGLGKMGANIARRMSGKGWRVVGYNRTVSVTQDLAAECGIEVANTLEAIAPKLAASPRILFTILPAQVLDEVLPKLAATLHAGDVIIDSANANYKDTIRRHAEMKQLGIDYIDVGFSGGPSGALQGGCLMIGGEDAVYEKCKDILFEMAAPGAAKHFPGVGAGHFVKTVHNGIEYGMMQAIAEGFDVLHLSPFQLDLLDACDIYQNGSVIESRLLSWMKDAYEKYGNDLAEVSGAAGQGGGVGGAVGNKGEAVWTVEAAAELGTTAVVIDDSVKARALSREKPNYQGKVVQALRNEFGGHGTK